MTLRQEEKLVERRVAYALELDGKCYIIENVPARVDEKTGEQFFSPSTVERLQRMILEHVEQGGRDTSVSLFRDGLKTVFTGRMVFRDLTYTSTRRIALDHSELHD